MKQIVVISGKGGTGKTSLVASFASLSRRAVLADCDVDAADLHLVLNPIVKSSEEYSGGLMAYIDPDLCSGCGFCTEVCRFDAIIETPTAEGENSTLFYIDPLKCEGCGVCAYYCPEKAIKMFERKSGEVYISEMKYGPMVHAQLGIAEENSGKLVAQVREEATKLAQEGDYDYIIIDGPPGVGCPVISSITGADIVLIVTEPTVSGLSDLERVAQLARHFKIPSAVCVNKWDINPENTDSILDYCENHNIKILGKIHYDRTFTEAQIRKVPALEVASSDLKKEIVSVWERLNRELENHNK